MNKKNVLVACEYSGTVRDAFENAGWNAWSCDILPTESEQTLASGKHYQGNCLDLLQPHNSIRNCGVEKWDLMIGHPPCTYLSYAYTGKERYSVNRLQAKIKAYQFFLDLWAAPIEHICLENPMGYIHSGLLPCSQIIEPYYWGKKYNENYKKRTCLWLKNLPLLTYSTKDTLFEKGEQVEPKFYFVNSLNKSRAKYNSICKPFDSKKNNSKFHKGIAEAMAKQWMEYFINLDL